MSATSRQPSTLPADALLAVGGAGLEHRTRSRVMRATQRVSFEVNPADHFILLSPSDYGESTLLKAVAGFIPPNEGEIRLQGQAIRALGPDRIMVLQESDQLSPWKTVQQNVLFPLRVSGQVTHDETGRRTDECLEEVGLAGFAEAYPRTLSGGMETRVAIARALTIQPKILLMDEPFTALNALTRRKTQEELLRLWEEVRFILLFVTHSIEEALMIDNHILPLSPYPGRVRAEVHGHPFGLRSLGDGPLQAVARRIPRLPFDEGGEPTATETLDFTDIRLAH